jgi:hypothetical protein
MGLQSHVSIIDAKRLQDNGDSPFGKGVAAYFLKMDVLGFSSGCYSKRKYAGCRSFFNHRFADAFPVSIRAIALY